MKPIGKNWDKRKEKFVTVYQCGICQSRTKFPERHKCPSLKKMLNELDIEHYDKKIIAIDTENNKVILDG